MQIKDFLNLSNNFRLAELNLFHVGVAKVIFKEKFFMLKNQTFID